MRQHTLDVTKLGKLLTATPDHNLSKDIWRSDLDAEFKADKVGIGAYFAGQNLNYLKGKLLGALEKSFNAGKFDSLFATWETATDDEKKTLLTHNFGEGIEVPAFIEGDTLDKRIAALIMVQELLIADWLSNCISGIDANNISAAIEKYTQDIPSLTHKGMGEKSGAVIKSLLLDQIGWQQANIDFSHWTVTFKKNESHVFLIEVLVSPELVTSDLSQTDPSTDKGKEKKFPMGTAHYTFTITEANEIALQTATCDNSALADLINGKRDLSNDPEKSKLAYYQVVKEQLQKDAKKTQEERIDILMDLAKTLNIPIDLSYMNLQKINLSNKDLTAADLTGADLTGTDLTETILTRANLSNATFDLNELKKAKNIDYVVMPINIEKLNVLSSQNSNVALSPDDASLLPCSNAASAPPEKTLSQLAVDLCRSSDAPFTAGENKETFAAYLRSLPENQNMQFSVIINNLNDAEKETCVKNWLKKNMPTVSDENINAMIAAYAQTYSNLTLEAFDTQSHAANTNENTTQSINTKETHYTFSASNSDGIELTMQSAVRYQAPNTDVSLGRIDYTFKAETLKTPANTTPGLSIVRATCTNSVLSDLINGTRPLAVSADGVSDMALSIPVYYQAYKQELLNDQKLNPQERADNLIVFCKNNTEVTLDLSDMDLQHVDFKGKNLAKANLRATQLQGVNLEGVNLEGAIINSNTAFTNITVDTKTNVNKLKYQPASEPASALDERKIAVVNLLQNYIHSRGETSDSGFKLDFFRRAPWHNQTLTEEKIADAKKLILQVLGANSDDNITTLLQTSASDKRLNKALISSDYQKCLEQCIKVQSTHSVGLNRN